MSLSKVLTVFIKLSEMESTALVLFKKSQQHIVVSFKLTYYNNL